MGNNQSLSCHGRSPPRNPRPRTSIRLAQGINSSSAKALSVKPFSSNPTIRPFVAPTRSKEAMMPILASKSLKNQNHRNLIGNSNKSNSARTSNSKSHSINSVTRMPPHTLLNTGDEKTGTFRGIQAPMESSLLPCILFTFFYPHDRFDEYLLKRHRGNRRNSKEESDNNILKIRGIIENRIIHNMRTYPYFSSHAEWNFLEELYSKDLFKLNKDPEYTFNFLFNELLEIDGFLEFDKSETGFLHQLLCPRYMGSTTCIRIADLKSFKTNTSPAMCSPFLILELKRVNYDTPFVFPIELDVQHPQTKSEGQLDLYGVICLPTNDHGSWKAFVRNKTEGENSFSWIFYDPQSQGLIDSCQNSIPKVEALPGFEKHVQEFRTAKSATTNTNNILRDGSIVGQRLKTLLHHGYLFIYYDPEDPKLRSDPSRAEKSPIKPNKNKTEPKPEMKVRHQSKEAATSQPVNSTRLEDNILEKPSVAPRSILIKPSPIEPLLKESINLSTQGKVEYEAPPLPQILKQSGSHTANLKTDDFNKLFIRDCNHGKDVGLKGRDNSTSIDSVLFSMFYVSKIFDEWVLLPIFSKTPKNSFGKRVRRILQFEIIDNLRGNHYVPYECTRKLCEALAEINPKFLDSIIDVDELIATLMEGALEVNEFINYSIGAPSYIHQIKIDSRHFKERVTNVQSLVESSMKFQNLQLVGVPCPAFILKMPRSHGTSLGGFDEILPNLTLDIRSIICTGRDSKFTSSLELGSVIVLKNGRYTSYVRMGLSSQSQWLYFDSMLTRVKLLPQLGEELEFAHQVMEGKETGEGREWSRHFHRLITNIHLCIYFSPDTVLNMKSKVGK